VCILTLLLLLSKLSRSFFRVKLLVNRRTKDEVALKIINLKDHPAAQEIVRKEIQIHKMLNHENIVKFFGSRNDMTVEYLFLEYVCGGELYDQIGKLAELQQALRLRTG